jgi:hypothetical protein
MPSEEREAAGLDAPRQVKPLVSFVLAAVAAGTSPAPPAA